MKIMLILCFAMTSTTAFAQSRRVVEKVKTQMLQLPETDATTVDYANLKVQFAVADLAFDAPKVSETKQPCPVKNRVTGEMSVKEVPAWGYTMSYTAVDKTILRDGSGAITMVHDRPSTGSVSAGCIESEKKARSATSNSAKLSKKENKARKVAIKPSVRPSVKKLLFVEYQPVTVKVSGAEGEHDYAAIQAAQTKAIAAYQSMANDGVSDEPLATLTELIPVWEKELAGYAKDKTSRINKPVAKGLWSNIIDAAIFTGDMEKAVAGSRGLYAITRADGDTSQYTPARVSERIASFAPGRAVNNGDWAALHALALAAEKNKKFKIEVVPLADVAAELEAFQP